MSEVDTAAEWQNQVQTLLDAYLREFGISAEAVRRRWVNRVIDHLATRTELVATEDILEKAVENLHDLLETRIAMVCNFDPEYERKEIAQILVVLLDEKNTDYLNHLFEHIETAGDYEIPEQLQHTIASSLPIPVPQEAPLAMPVQTIKLRSINPLRWLFGCSS